jgi:hypothetical protein
MNLINWNETYTNISPKLLGIYRRCFKNEYLKFYNKEIFKKYFYSNCNLFSFLTLIPKMMYINQNYSVMKKLLILLNLLLCSFLLLSCSNDDQNTSPTINNQADVYVAGSKNGQACYWKNSQLVSLDSGLFSHTEANKIIISGGDVYVLGKFRDENQISILFWKNGILTNLSNALISANERLLTIDIDMEVVGNDVYFIGYTETTTSNDTSYNFCYWKNIVKTVLSNDIRSITNKIEIKVIANSIYITGSNNNKYGYYINTNFYEARSSNGLVVKNSDVYFYLNDNNSNVTNLKNLNTNVSTTFSVNNWVSKMTFENNNFYYLDGDNLYKEGAILITNNVWDFSVFDNNVYKIIGVETNDSRLLQINDTTVMSASSGEYFNSLFIVQN